MKVVAYDNPLSAVMDGSEDVVDALIDQDAIKDISDDAIYRLLSVVICMTHQGAMNLLKRL